MTKDEALALALEALETLARYENPETRVQVRKPKDNGPIVTMYPHKVATDAITAIKQARALDKKADNARELGLDYEPSAKVRDFWEGYVPEPVKPAPVQEPVAWMEMVVANLVREGVNKHKARELAEHFYTTPLAARPAVPVAIVSGYYGGQCVIQPMNPARIFNSGTAFYTTPPAGQRQWVGLTDEEVMELAFNFDVPSLVIRTAEAKLKEKNNG